VDARISYRQTRRVSVKSYGDVLREYEFHPEAKCADSSGAPCKKQTVGLLGRRHVAIDSITCIGKESNRLEEVEEQSLLDPSDVYTIFDDPRRDEWKAKWLPLLRSTPIAHLLEQGVSRATIYAARSGRALYETTKRKLIRRLQAARATSRREVNSSGSSERGTHGPKKSSDAGA
jgi:hypothetical protein